MTDNAYLVRVGDEWATVNRWTRTADITTSPDVADAALMGRHAARLIAGWHGGVIVQAIRNPD